MATSIITCAGSGSAWVTPDDGESFTCPECLLTPQELGIKTRKTSKGLNPATIPDHEVEVDGVEVRYVLTNGDFEVHTPSCPQLKRDLAKSDYEKPGTVVAVSREDAVRFLWDDQIAEAFTQPVNPDEPDGDHESYEPTTDELAEHGYFEATHFHGRCLSKILPDPTSTAKVKSTVKRDAKRALADLVVAAIAEVLNGELPAAVLAGMTVDEAKRITVQQIHHLPVNRDNWPETIPTPDRSDWAPKDTETAEEVDEPSDDSDDGDDAEDTTEE